MLKRTFVLLFWPLLTMVFVLLPEQSKALYKQEINANSFSPYTTPEILFIEYAGLCEDMCDEDIAIVRADDFEWKESITHLLRHRSSSYRFVSLESEPSLFLDFIVNYNGIANPLHTFAAFNKRVILPDYYSFLHRLCPF